MAAQRLIPNQLLRAFVRYYVQELKRARYQRRVRMAWAHRDEAPGTVGMGAIRLPAVAELGDARLVV